jgi:DNA-binding NarL/FixJ family response regulator
MGSINAKQINVLVVEDDFYTRRDIVRKINSDSNFRVEMAGTRDEAIAYLTDHSAEIVDLGLPDGPGLSVIEFAMKNPNPPNILVLSSAKDETSVLAAISAGASGYIVKDSTSHDLVAAIYQLRDGYSSLSPSIARFILRSFNNRMQKDESTVDVQYDLSTREQSVLAEIVRGATYREIAGKLSITEATVQSHVKQVYRKLGVNSRTKATLLVLGEK